MALPSTHIQLGFGFPFLSVGTGLSSWKVVLPVHGSESSLLESGSLLFSVYQKSVINFSCWFGMSVNVDRRTSMYFNGNGQLVSVGVNIVVRGWL